ncbi:hypothetical protein JK159_08350 [Weissella minor]|uniref:hypothetical protein n=1 Tax=Weissella minor TaxID=1620 RepID=UPI001BAF6347|nr:hypothetical protein [Weissella minor]MBS0950365.1 hypothetical protein [Weissella minor]
MNEPILITDMGEKITPEMFEKDYIKSLSDEQAVEFARFCKLMKSLLDLPVKDVERRAKENEDGVVGKVHYKPIKPKTVISDTEETKQAFWNKYGWKAFDIKSETQLKKEFGESIKEDISKVATYQEQQRLDWSEV